MDIVREAYLWSNHALAYCFLGLHAWGFVDCLLRKASAFPAAGKLTKWAWLAILFFSGLFGWYIPPVAGIVSIVALLVVTVYLADVRPAVRDIARGT